MNYKGFTLLEIIVVLVQSLENQTILFKFDDLDLWIEKNNPDKG